MQALKTAVPPHQSIVAGAHAAEIARSRAPARTGATRGSRSRRASTSARAQPQVATLRRQRGRR